MEKNDSCKAQVSYLISSLCGGGAERIAVEIYSVLASNFSQQFVKIYDEFGNGDKYTIERSIVLSKRGRNIIDKLWKLLLSSIKYARLLKSSDVKVSLSFLPLDNVMNIVSSFLSNTTPIISFHLSPTYTFGKHSNYTTRLSLLLAKIIPTHIVSVSKGIKDELIKEYGVSENKISVIYNPINFEKINQMMTDTLDLIINEPIILAVGRLEPEKGHRHLLRVFAELRKEIPSTLIICGEGSLKADLIELANNLGIIDNVIFNGWTDNPYKFMRRASVFVQPSLSEALPNVILEALYCGCPVIATDSGPGIAELIDPRKYEGIITSRLSGIKYQSNDPLDEGERDLMIHLSRVLQDEMLRNQLSQNGKGRVKDFSYEKSISEYNNLISKYIE